MGCERTMAGLLYGAECWGCCARAILTSVSVSRVLVDMPLSPIAPSKQSVDIGALLCGVGR